MYFTVSTPVRASIALAFISAIEAQVGRCIFSGRKDLCCSVLNQDFLTKEQFKNLEDGTNMKRSPGPSWLKPGTIICKGPSSLATEKCFDIVERRITSIHLGFHLVKSEKGKKIRGK